MKVTIELDDTCEADGFVLANVFGGAKAQNVQAQRPTLVSDHIDFLIDLRERIRHIPTVHGTDGMDIDMLGEILAYVGTPRPLEPLVKADDVDVPNSKTQEAIEASRAGDTTSATAFDDILAELKENPGIFDDRIYGKAEHGRSRRTKVQLGEDKDLSARWTAIWPSKEVPEKAVTALELFLEKFEADSSDETTAPDPAEEEEEEGSAPEENEPSGEIPLEDFRAIISTFAAQHGGKALVALMKPYRSGADVPAELRAEFIAKIEEA
jgi:hypothetical protein